MFKQFLSITAALGLLFSANAFCHPASTEYVRTAIDELRAELNTHFNSVTSQLDARTTNIQAQVSQLPIVTHHIGETLQGGMVFWVDQSQQHGLIVSLTDLADAVEWRNGASGDRKVNANSSGLEAGEMNTRLIIAQQTIDQQDGQFAALAADNYQASADGSPCPPTTTPTELCYSGWYLPSAFELALIYNNLKINGLMIFSEAFYWSSTEANETQALLVDFSQGEISVADKSTLGHIRAIHPF